MHGNNWKKIAQGLSRDPASCKEKWRNLKCTKKGRSLDSELCGHVGSILFLKNFCLMLVSLNFLGLSGMGGYCNLVSLSEVGFGNVVVVLRAFQG